MTFDPVAFSRSGIEPHEQDNYREPLDVLIDAARDSVQALLDAGNPLGPAYLESWAASGIALLERLAVHGFSYRKDIASTAKLQWLLTTALLDRWELQHEVFQLLAAALPDADRQVADLIVAVVLRRAEDAAVEQHPYTTYNILTWINTHSSGLESAEAALAAIAAVHPEFEPREHPDLHTWMEAGFAGPVPPMAPGELAERLLTDANVVMSELLEYQTVEHGFHETDWGDVLVLVSETVSQRPELGDVVLDALDELPTDVTKAVIAGWAAVAAAPGRAELILSSVMRLDLPTLAAEVARLLWPMSRSDGEAIAWHEIHEAQALAAELWTLLPSQPAPPVNDGLQHAINDPAGWLAQFWIQAVAARWRAAGQGWDGLTSDIRTALETMLSGPTGRREHAQVVLASQVDFFFGADRSWCETHVLPLLGWDTPDRAARCWDGYLSWGRWNDELLSAGLLNGYLGAVDHVEDLPELKQRRLAEHLAGIALQSSLPADSWLPRFTRHAGEQLRVEWIQQVAFQMLRLPREVVDDSWDRWMREYWRGRLESVPMPLEDAESNAIAAWAVHVPSDVAEAVDLAIRHPAGLGHHGDLLRELAQRVSEFPGPYLVLLTHLLRHTSTQIWSVGEISEIIRVLRASDLDVTPILEQTTRLGLNIDT